MIDPADNHHRLNIDFQSSCTGRMRLRNTASVNGINDGNKYSDTTVIIITMNRLHLKSAIGFYIFITTMGHNWIR